MSKPTDFVPVAIPLLGDEELQAVARPLQSGWVSQGPEVAEFEREFAVAVGSNHACAVSSCTAALHLALLAVGVKPGDEVVTVSHSFIATANAIRYCGAIPVFIDIEPDSYNIDPELIEAVISERTKAILCVHQVGMPCDLQAILSVSRRHKLPVIEDAACAIGSEILVGDEWESIGKPHGDIACFSFHPRKVITTGDGGMLTTNNPDFDRQFRLWRQHCMDVPDAVRHSAREVIFESYPQLGFNYRLTDIQAAIGREQLKRLPAIIHERRARASRYAELLEDIDGLGLPQEPDWARTNWQSYIVRLPNDVDQRAIMQTMLDAGIATRRGIMCSHREEAYAADSWSCGSQKASCACAPNTCKQLEHSENAQDQTIVLPLFVQLTEAQQNHVAASLKTALGHKQ
jgi:perosamine synthetase